VRKAGSQPISKVKKETLDKMKDMLRKDPTLTAKQLKGKLPELTTVSIRHIQHVCLKKLDLPSRKMASKPLLTERMKQQRLKFLEYSAVDEHKKVMFSNKSQFELHFGKKEAGCRRPKIGHF
jgi:hypothetical protein